MNQPTRRDRGERIGLAFLGCGDVARRDYLPELQRIARRIELVAVCGRGEERVRAVAEEHGFRHWYTDYAQMLARDDVDAVVNLTPIQLHDETNLAVLQAGKHLYSEKPLATSVAAARRIRQEGQRQGRVIVAAPCVMLFPQVRHAAALLAQNAIGPVHAASGVGHGGVPPWRGYTSDPTPFFSPGGGPAMDMGVYPLHALTGLLGPAQRVGAMTARVLERFTVPDGPARGREVAVDVDDNWHMVLDLGDRRIAWVDATNCVRATRIPQLEMRGLDGTLALDLLDVSAPLAVHRAGRGWQEVTLPQRGRATGPDHLLGVEHLLDCIENQAEPVLSVEHALHVVEIIEKAARAAESGESQIVESRFPRPPRGGA